MTQKKRQTDRDRKEREAEPERQDRDRERDCRIEEGQELGSKKAADLVSGPSKKINFKINIYQTEKSFRSLIYHFRIIEPRFTGRILFL